MENLKEVIEYPQNYEEIVARKLAQLEVDYQNTIKANFTEDINQDDDDSIDEDGKESELVDKQPSEKIENNYYQCLNDCEDNELDINDNEFIEVNEECNTEVFEFVKEEKEDKTKATFIDPIKNPDKIKEAMKKIKLQPPRWAQK